MRKLIYILVLMVAAAACAPSASAQLPGLKWLDRLANTTKIPLDSAAVARGDSIAHDEKVIVDGDTLSIILPQKNYGRYDRGLFNYLFVPKGQWAFGLIASYGEFGTDNLRVLSMLKDLNLAVKAYSVQPSIAYFFDNNQSIGVNFKYVRTMVDLAGLKFDFSDDMNFTLRDVSYYSKNYSSAVAYRNYIGLGRDGRFGVFNELELAFAAGSSRFCRYYGGQLYDTRTSSMETALNFSPGVCIFMMDNVGFNLSFGVFGVNLHHERQSTNGIADGSRFSSGANFRFNLFNINFGMAVFI